MTLTDCTGKANKGWPFLAPKGGHVGLGALKLGETRGSGGGKRVGEKGDMAKRKYRWTKESNKSLRILIWVT